MTLLQSRISTSVIALWLGQREHERTTHVYLQADLAPRRRTLDHITPASRSPRPLPGSRPHIALPRRSLNGGAIDDTRAHCRLSATLRHGPRSCFRAPVRACSMLIGRLLSRAVRDIPIWPGEQPFWVRPARISGGRLRGGSHCHARSLVGAADRCHRKVKRCIVVRAGGDLNIRPLREITWIRRCLIA